jgi:hypothetical protein
MSEASGALPGRHQRVNVEMRAVNGRFTRENAPPQSWTGVKP